MEASAARGAVAVSFYRSSDSHPLGRLEPPRNII